MASNVADGYAHSLKGVQDLTAHDLLAWSVSMEAPETTVVCDLGSGAHKMSICLPSPYSALPDSPISVHIHVGSLKVGFAGHHYPRAIVRSVVEKSTTPHQSDTRNGAPKWVYKPVIEANYQQGCVENDGYENPCVNGIVANWDAMQVLLEHTFSQLQVCLPPDTTVGHDLHAFLSLLHNSRGVAEIY